MSLKDPDEEYEELVNEKSIIPKGLFKKSKMLIFLLLIGIVIGIFLQYYMLNPIVTDLSTASCASIKSTNQLLNAENDCLYYALGTESKNASEKCATRNLIERQNIQDFNEETY
jgi:flagellar motor component MotA